jgi:endo-1,3-1,4-beta-glycanase ExoK
MCHLLARPASWTRGVLLGLALGSAAAAQDAAPEDAAAQDVGFLDAFDALDTGRWYVSDGWSNGDWQACTWSQRMVSVKEGVLELTLAPTEAGADTYLCGEVQTNEQFGYGTFEARLRTDRASGVNAAFFTYIGPVHDRTHEEIDVEILTRDTSRFEVNTYRDGQSAGGQAVPLPTSADAEFHTYSFIWEPDGLRWYLDGALVHEVTGADLPQPPQKIYLSHWNSRTFTDWMGPFTDPGRPLTLSVDWVAYTPPGAGCQFEGSVLCVPGVEG